MVGTQGYWMYVSISVYKESLREITLKLVCKFDDNTEMDTIWFEARTLLTLVSIFQKRLKLRKSTTAVC
jgi:hypothetical protein